MSSYSTRRASTSRSVPHSLAELSSASSRPCPGPLMPRVPDRKNTSWRRRPSGRRLAVSRLNRSFVGSLTTDGFRPESGIERQLSHSRERSLVVLLRWQDCVRSRDLSSYHSRHRLRRSLLCSSTCYPVGASDRMVVGFTPRVSNLKLDKVGTAGRRPFYRCPIRRRYRRESSIVAPIQQEFVMLDVAALAVLRANTQISASFRCRVR